MKIKNIEDLEEAPFENPSYVNIVVKEQENIFGEGKSYFVVHINGYKDPDGDWLSALLQLEKSLGEGKLEIAREVIKAVGGDAEDRLTISGGIETTYRRPGGKEDTLTIDLVNQELVFVKGEEVTKEPLTEEGIAETISNNIRPPF